VGGVDKGTCEKIESYEFSAERPVCWREDDEGPLPSPRFFHLTLMLNSESLKPYTPT
jgi:hypothetical protein